VTIKHQKIKIQGISNLDARKTAMEEVNAR